MTPLSVSGNAFASVPISTCTLHVPAWTEALYKAAPVWKNFYFPVSVSLEISPESLDFTAAASSKRISVTSNINWTVSSSESWASVSPASGSNDGTVTVTVPVNSTGSARTATITISGDDIIRTVQVTQQAPTPELNVSLESLDFTATAGSKQVSVTSNVNWTASSSTSWATVSPESGSILRAG
jgi:hypothetical protein